MYLHVDGESYLPPSASKPRFAAVAVEEEEEDEEGAFLLLKKLASVGCVITLLVEQIG